MKRAVEVVDAKPSKRIYQSIIADYGLDRSICELIDNALDAWSLGEKKGTLSVKVEFDLDQQSIRVTDTAGGVKQAELTYVVAPGHTGTKPVDQAIGFFGVGTKRAVVALAEIVQIRSRWQKEKTFLVEFNDEWVQEEENWDVECFEVDLIDPGSTRIDLSRLRRKISEENVADLKAHLSATYANFLQDPHVVIEVDGDAIKPRLFDNWAYPPKYPPRELTGFIEAPEGRRVETSIRGGLTTESSPATGEYGVYFYCNNRLIARALKTPDVGFIKGIAGLPHPKVAITRVVVSLKGDARDMPWNSSKSAIDTNSAVFHALRERLYELVKYYAVLSRGWVGEWDEKVFEFTKGSITTEKVDDFKSAKRSKLPPLPQIKPRFTDVLKRKNETLIQKKPWTEGLQDGVIATEIVYRARLSQKNRIALIVLDSTLEIAFKDYLVHVAAIGQHKFRQIIDNRKAVIDEVKKSTQIAADDWQKVDYYYKLRCGLIHEKASVDIPDKHIVNFRALVERILNELHGLEF